MSLSPSQNLLQEMIRLISIFEINVHSNRTLVNHCFGSSQHIVCKNNYKKLLNVEKGQVLQLS